ncbi:MAG: succinate dehydrogenase cytochrome b subunit [Planctomycetes bacterium]|nr:succinate dehydrogenase cytochrome b subunit [Planctomycetota bacterium]
MNGLLASLGTSIGRKMVVAVTGLMLLLFVLAHMAGNLQVFAGPEALNSYAAKLQSLGPLLWAARLGLLAVFGVHVALTLKLASENKEARPTAYAHQTSVQATSASRTMVMSGLLVVAFVLYHLAHFTFGVVQPGNHELVETLADGTTRHDVFSMVVLGFQNPLVAISYVVAMALLCWHVSHGVQSVFQTLGLQSARSRDAVRKASLGIAALIFVGNASMPLACLLHLVDIPSGN